MAEYPELYIQDRDAQYPGIRVTPEDLDVGSFYDDIADFLEEWGGRKFVWRGIRVRVQGDTRIKHGVAPTPFMRVLSVGPLEN